MGGGTEGMGKCVKLEKLTVDFRPVGGGVHAILRGWWLYKSLYLLIVSKMIRCGGFITLNLILNITQLEATLSH